MKKCIAVINLLTVLLLQVNAQEMVLSLDTCVAMAMRENTQLQIAHEKAAMATDTRKSARTKYLPRVEALGGYMHMGKEVSLLNAQQKSTLQYAGTNIANQFNAYAQQVGQTMPALAGAIQQYLPGLQQSVGVLQQALDQVGNSLVDALRTDTRNMFGGAVTLTQPLYMGGKIVNGNKMADIAEEIANIQIDQATDDVRFNVENTYYLVVGVEHKKKLADEYAALIAKLEGDVKKMIDEGVATKADGLKVSVKLNEAQMQQLQAENGLSLSKMLLCKLCGLPLETNISVDTTMKVQAVGEINTTNNRNEIKMLSKAIELYDLKVKTARAEHLPQVALMGGYMVSNPSMFNGFEKKFNGTWNVGVMAKIPIWDWNETRDKVREAKRQSNIARLQKQDAEEMIDLQITQCQFKLDEAKKKMVVTEKNYDTAEENLRCANLGFAEGVMATTDVMMAQTAWLQAKTQKIEAEIEVVTAQLALIHAYGN